VKRTKPITRAPWQKPPRVPVRTQLDPGLRAQVRERAAGRCELCTDPLGASWEAHHRKLRSRGGQDSICNLVALCHGCHRRCHGHVAWAEEHGFIVASYDDPATVPLALHLDRWVLLAPSGDYRDLP
jgi:hypothetical protein